MSVFLLRDPKGISIAVGESLHMGGGSSPNARLACVLSKDL